MVTVNIICVGKLKEKFYLAAVEEYAKRLSRSCKLNLIELTEQRLDERPSPAPRWRRSRSSFRQSCPRAAWSSPCALRAS